MKDLIDAFKKPTLFRGDNRRRCCKNKSAAGQSVFIDRYITDGLFTNLICHGDPRHVERNGVRQTVTNHVAGWDLSHYLSFSVNYEVAKKYAVGRSGKILAPHNGGQWEAAIFTMNTGAFEVELRSVGVYFGFWPNKNACKTRIALIDVETLLEADLQDGKPCHAEYRLGKDDQEWLVIPLDPMPDGIGFEANLKPYMFQTDLFCYV